MDIISIPTSPSDLIYSENWSVKEEQLIGSSTELVIGQILRQCLLESSSLCCLLWWRVCFYTSKRNDVWGKSSVQDKNRKLKFCVYWWKKRTYELRALTLSSFQIKVWTANPQQFVEDEDDDTFSYTVRIAAQDLVLVRGFPDLPAK